MVNAKFALLCDYALISQEGKLSILGEFDRIFTSSDSAVLSRGFVVAKFTGTVGEDMMLKIQVEHKESGEVIVENDMQVKLDDNGNGGVIFELVGVGFKKIGSYIISLRVDKKVIAELPLEVVRISQPKVAKA